MSGNNMEALLMDDSSSGDSDEEVNLPMGTTTTAASAVNVATTAPAAPHPTQTTAPAPRAPTVSTQAAVPGSSASVPAPNRGKASQNDQMARLKNLYSMSKSTTSSNPSTGLSNQGNQTVQKPLHRPPMQQNMQQQQQPQQQQPQQQQPQQQQPQQQQPLQRQPRQSVVGHQVSQHRSQLYPPSSQQGPQQQIPSRPQPQQRQTQYSQSSSQQRQQYAQQTPQQRPPPRSMQSRQPLHMGPPQSHSGTSTQQQQDQQVTADPFAPTPLSQIKQSHSTRRTHHQHQMQHQRQAGQSAPTSRNQKEKFLMFTRVLIKYLEQKDRRMHAEAKSIIKDCAERNKRQEPGYESVTTSMKRRLKELVGEHYWKKANDYLVHFIEQKRRHAQQAQVGGGSGGSTSAAQLAARMHQKHSQQQQLQHQSHPPPTDRQANLKARKDPALSVPPKMRAPASTSTAPSLTDIQKGIQDKKEQLTSQASITTSKTTTKSKSKTTAASKASGSDSKTTKAKTTKKTTQRRKSAGESSTSSRKSTASKTVSASTSTSTIIKRVVVEEPPREYKELMELIDHSVEYNWPSIGQLLGNKSDLKLTDEERQLLYGDSAVESLSKKKATKNTMVSTFSPMSSNSQDQSPNKRALEEEDQVDQNFTGEGIRPGWGETNVVSARAAWARIRLPELRQRQLASKDSPPVVGDGLLTLPKASPHQSPSTSTKGTSATSIQEPDVVTPKPEVIEGSWVDEKTAEQDESLALLSEACQIYLKGVLQKAVQCARQRQNLDGIRLWHQQYAFNKGASASSSSALSKDTKSKAMDKSKRPPLALRLGCDVSRQISQAHGNAALTVKRMEEALSRQTGIPMRVRDLNTETLLEATSMGDLSWRPLLKQGAEKAELQAKRSFEVYGGKEAKDPPLGRVPKKAKLVVEDFVMGSRLNIDGSYHKGFTPSSFISF